MRIGPAIAIGAATGLVLGIVISLTTDIPLAPELGLVLGGAGRLALAAQRPLGRTGATHL